MPNLYIMSHYKYNVNFSQKVRKEGGGGLRYEAYFYFVNLMRLNFPGRVHPDPPPPMYKIHPCTTMIPACAYIKFINSNSPLTLFIFKEMMYIYIYHIYIYIYSNYFLKLSEPVYLSYIYQFQTSSYFFFVLVLVKYRYTVPFIIPFITSLSITVRETQQKVIGTCSG